ncbi:unnamed protein product [Parascedosporium putredinis]|uniref:Peptidase A1 domain-containing protein n=1 Tax=Parascedosporium putredinis TaxID=1442378 RepID=A0A9P1ME49_9PEZI|nr:unnamed protein product [Parascedosporium putredinis]CAI8004932.1 unnamed protein product [Parascedosporium putredinis]
MVSISSKLALLFAGLALADSSSSSSSSFSAQSRTGAHLSHAPRNPLPERASGERAPLFGRPTTTDGSATEGKALRYALQQTRLNITEATAAAQRRWEHRMRRRIGEEEGGGAGLERREKWNWKHLEDYRGYLYFMEVEVGDPPQLVKLSPDTGSFETWMNPNCENSASPYLCVVNGMYHPENSELAVTQNEPFDFSYGNGWVNGKYYEDRIYFRNEDVGIRQKFGMATDSSYAVSGILGLGYGMGYTIGYSNVLDSLVKFDLINAPAYSVSLGGQGEGTSEIVFGGVNQAKYSGLLKAVPIWPSVAQQLPNYVHYRVNVTSFGFTKPTGAKTAFFSRTAAPLNVLVDTGVTYSLLPGAMVASIAEVFGAWWDVGEYKVDCALRDQAGTFDFGFNNDGLIIRVRYFDFILKLQDNTCTLGVQQGADNDAILGNTFLRGRMLSMTN